MPIQKKFLLAALGAGLIAASAANAGIVTYANWANYNAATVNNTVIDFDQHTNFFYGTTVVAGDVTFKENADRLFVLPGGYYGEGFTSNYLNNNAIGDMTTITFAHAVHGFAMDFGMLANWNWGSGAAQELTFNFAGGSKTIALPGGLASNQNPLSFVGFSSDVAFTSVTINDPMHSLALDNFTYTSAAAIPEPGSLALLGLGLLGAAFMRRKQSAK